MSSSSHLAGSRMGQERCRNAVSQPRLWRFGIKRHLLALASATEVLGWPRGRGWWPGWWGNGKSSQGGWKGGTWRRHQPAVSHALSGCSCARGTRGGSPAASCLCRGAEQRASWWGGRKGKAEEKERQDGGDGCQGALWSPRCNGGGEARRSKTLIVRSMCRSKQFPCLLLSKADMPATQHWEP